MILKVGDKIAAFVYSELNSIYEIERVTKTMAISGVFRFKLEYENPNYIRVVNPDSFSRKSYSIATEHDIDLYERMKLIHEISKTDFNEFQTEKLAQILNLINNG